MAFEGLRGSVGRGASAAGNVIGATAQNRAVNVRQQGLENERAKANIDRLAGMIEDDRVNTLKTTDALTAVAVGMIEKGTDTLPDGSVNPEFTRIVNGIPNAIDSHGGRREGFIQSAIAGGVDPDDARRFGGVAEFRELNLPIYQAQLAGASRDEGNVWINFRNKKTGAERTVRAGADEAEELAGGDWVRVGIVGRTLQSDDPDTIFGGDPRTPSQVGSDFSDSREQFNESANIQEMISSALPRIHEVPGATGAKGRIGVALSGFATTLGQDELANGIAEAVTGAKPEEVSQIIAQLQAVRGQLIPIVTGQESRARLSDKEQELGDRAVALINEITGPASLTRAYPQVVGALRQFYVESWAKQFRLAKQNGAVAGQPVDGGINYPFDLSNDDDAQELIGVMQNAGLDTKTILAALTRLETIQIGSQ